MLDVVFRVPLGDYYVKLIKKVEGGDHAHVTDQIARLTKMAADPSVKPAKRTEFLKKLNILRVFEAEHNHAAHGHPEL